MGEIIQYGPSASAVLLAQGSSNSIAFDGVANALCQPQTQMKLFGKPEIDGSRRLGVALTRRESIESAVKDAVDAANKIKVIL